MELVAVDRGIAADRSGFGNYTTNGVWYKSSVFVTTNNITGGSGYIFTYEGTICGFWIHIKQETLLNIL